MVLYRRHTGCEGLGIRAMNLRRVILESPFAAREGFTIEQNIAYAKLCMRDCLSRGEAPIASHLLWTQANLLDDNNPAERKLGMHAGWAWIPCAQASVVYEDHGISSGMEAGIKFAVSSGLSVERRRLSNYVPPKSKLTDITTQKDEIVLRGFYRTRDYNIVEIIETNDKDKNYIFHTVAYRFGPDGVELDGWRSTIGPGGRYLPQLGGPIREHDRDLIERVNEKDFQKTS